MTEKKDVSYFCNIIQLEARIYNIYKFFANFEKNKNHEKFNSSKLCDLNLLQAEEKKFFKQLSRDDLEMFQKILLFIENDYANKFGISFDNEIILDRILFLMEERQEQLDFYELEEEDYFAGEFDMTYVEKTIEKQYKNEFYTRLQERIDSSEKDRNLLIDKKYDMLFTDICLDATVVCTGFNFRNLIDYKFDKELSDFNVLKAEYELSYLNYEIDLLNEIINKMIMLEKYGLEDVENRVLFKINDIHLEIILKSFDFVVLYELKKNLLKMFEKNGLKNSFVYILIEENFDEAINYVCNSTPKLSENKIIKKINISI